MNILQPEEYQERTESVPPFEVRMMSYRLGPTYHCTVYNLDPGSVIVRADGVTRREAEARALARASSRLASSARRIDDKDA
jgi:ribosomal protein L16/L10AE